MSADERVHRYAMLGLVAYIESKVNEYERANGFKPLSVVVGRLEWETIMGCDPTTEWSVKGVVVVPNDNRESGVSLP